MKESIFPTRHWQIAIKGKRRYVNFFLLPIVYYRNSKKLKFRWQIRSFTFPTKISWTYYLWLNIKTFLALPYLVFHNWYYCGRTGFRYEEIDYDGIYGE